MKIYLGIPTYNRLVEAKAFESIFFAGKQGVAHYKCESLSLLAYSFNRLYCYALNMRKSHGITHFLLLHADIVPVDPQTWVNTLKEEMLAHDADILSAVVPLKGPTGVTSTAIDKACEENPWAVRRYTMKEVMELPETFTDPALLVNSGCMLIDITKDWADKLYFTINDKITQKPDGTFMAHVESEDWGFSRQARKLGAKLYATRKIELSHVGSNDFMNNSGWGSEDIDPFWKGEL